MNDLNMLLSCKMSDAAAADAKADARERASGCMTTFGEEHFQIQACPLTVTVLGQKKNVTVMLHTVTLVGIGKSVTVADCNGIR